MRIMLDTNVLLSAVIFRSKMMWNMMARIIPPSSFKVK